MAERGTHERQWAGPARTRLRAARFCYGHLAGALAQALREHFETQGWLRRRSGERALLVTPLGRRALADWVGDQAIAQLS